jgi:hypothetical protein
MTGGCLAARSECQNQAAEKPVLRFPEHPLYFQPYSQLLHFTLRLTTLKFRWPEIGPWFRNCLRHPPWSI